MDLKNSKIGLGIVTYNRPEYLVQTIKGVVKHLLKEVDSIWIYDDGSDEYYSEIYKNLPPQIKVHVSKENKGVAVSKNWLIAKLIEEGCDYIFIGEDDIIPTNKKAITGYLKAAEATGISHMMFAHHGPANLVEPVFKSEYIEGYPSCIGAWTFYTRDALQDVGLHDENFTNAYEHVELTWRLVKAGYTTPWGAFTDVVNSHKWLKEIPESFNNSSIEKTPEWALKTVESLVYWRKKDPGFPLGEVLTDLENDFGKDI